MNTTAGGSSEPNNAAHDHEKYCVFEHGGSTFAILANAIREVGLRPAHARVPDAPPMLAGVVHLRNEFLPLLRDPEAFEPELPCGPRESQVVIVNGENGPWGLLVDRVIGLLPLDVSLSSGATGNRGLAAAVMGSATLEHRIIRVLDERSLHRSISEQLNRYWAQLNTSA
ncbi:MAG: chemotaxis protein CheW [Planctomycetales bacterium]|nr:chemotaxis protein CheW [Planctomycetales bacterium]MCA9166509.1 chemotaxis protein CheW [Planctomycetales bacterium]